MRPLAGRLDCGCVGHRGSAYRSLDPLGLTGQQANLSCNLAANPEAFPSIFSMEGEILHLLFLKCSFKFRKCQ